MTEEQQSAASTLYIILGAYDAPEKVLDIAAALMNGEPMPFDPLELLPFTPEQPSGGLTDADIMQLADLHEVKNCEYSTAAYWMFSDIVPFARAIEQRVRGGQEPVAIVERADHQTVGAFLGQEEPHLSIRRLHENAIKEGDKLYLAPPLAVPDGIVNVSAAQHALEEWFEELGIDLDVDDAARLFKKMLAAAPKPEEQP